jgi:hypothetical protein
VRTPTPTEHFVPVAIMLTYYALAFLGVHLLGKVLGPLSAGKGPTFTSEATKLWKKLRNVSFALAFVGGTSPIIAVLMGIDHIGNVSAIGWPSWENNSLMLSPSLVVWPLVLAAVFGVLAAVWEHGTELNVEVDGTI